MDPRFFFENFEPTNELQDDNWIWDHLAQAYPEVESSEKPEQPKQETDPISLLGGELSPINQYDQDSQSIDITNNIELPTNDNFYPQLEKELKLTEEDTQTLDQIFNNEAEPTASDTSDVPVEIPVALSLLSENQRHILEINVSLDDDQEIRNLKSNFNVSRGMWFGFKDNYTMHFVKDESKNTTKIIFIPNLNIYDAFSLAQQILRARAIKPENIFFYQIDHNKEFAETDIKLLNDLEKRTYASLKEELTSFGYKELQIKFTKFESSFKRDFDTALRSFLEKFNDLKYTANKTNTEYQGYIIGNDRSISLNTYYSLNMIHDKIISLSKSYSIELSISISKKSYEPGINVTVTQEQSNAQHLAPKAKRNFEEMKSNALTKRRHIANSAPWFQGIKKPKTKKSLLTSLHNIFQDNNLSKSLENQFQKTCLEDAPNKAKFS